MSPEYMTKPSIQFHSNMYKNMKLVSDIPCTFVNGLAYVYHRFPSQG